MPVIVGNSTINTAITSASVTENTPQGFAVYNATRNTVMPTLRLDFVNSNVLDPRITFARSSSATYFNSAGVMTTASTDVPRIDYDPVTGVCNGLLIEQASTNLFLQSTFQSNWGPGAGTLTANQLLSPDGTVNAAKFVENTAVSAFHYINQSVSKAASALVYTFSVFLKALGNRQVVLRMDSGGNGAIVTCDPVAGSIGAAGTYGTFTSASGTIQTIGNGWYRFSLTATSSTATTLVAQLETLNAGNNVYTGDGTSGFYCFGAQLEQLAFLTSYIATTSSTSTRAYDYPQISVSNFINTNSGAFYVECFTNNTPVSGTQGGAFRAQDSGSTTVASMIYTQQGGFLDYINAGGTTQLNTGIASLIGKNTKSAMSYSLSSNTMGAINGSLLSGLATNVSLPVTTLYLGSSAGPTFPGIWVLNGWIRKFTYYPAALSNNELISLTS